MIKKAIPLLVISTLCGCSTTQISDKVVSVSNKVTNVINQTINNSQSSEDSAKQYINIPKSIRFGDNGVIDERIKTECKSLGNQLSNYVVEYAPKFDLHIKQIEDFNPSTGAFVDLQFVNIFSRGNAFIGHRKSTAIKADLYINGELMSSKTIARNSNGGVFGSFKSSCSVLERTVDTLGSDVGKWLSTQNIKT